MDKVANQIYISRFPATMLHTTQHFYCDEADNLTLLQSTNIKSIISLGKGFTAKHAGIQYHLIPIDDDVDENILEFLDDGVAFLEAAVAAGQDILVHCVAGVSRSATLVAAYLMKTRDLDVEGAVALIREGRPCVCPNDGFIKQLEIYKRMGCVVNKESSEYRRFLLSLAASEQQQLGTLTKLRMTADPTKAKSTGPQQQQQPRSLRCKMCRRMLLPMDAIIPHESGTGQNAFQYRKRDSAITQMTTAAAAASSASQSSNNSKCSSYCTEPMEWMEEVSDGHLEGKIACPNTKCNSKLGSFSWSGIACPCGTWVAPAFMINKQKVDVIGLL
ncbi:protein-tyrosine phosphatase-like protein [Obelidium mucronatum]|nr:protein-tyrosine phosphatase-like protein [Obelidium mucronatum]